MDHFSDTLFWPENARPRWNRFGKLWKKGAGSRDELTLSRRCSGGKTWPDLNWPFHTFQIFAHLRTHVYLPADLFGRSHTLFGLRENFTLQAFVLRQCRMHHGRYTLLLTLPPESSKHVRTQQKITTSSILRAASSAPGVLLWVQGSTTVPYTVVKWMLSGTPILAMRGTTSLSSSGLVKPARAPIPAARGTVWLIFEWVW